MSMALDSEDYMNTKSAVLACIALVLTVASGCSDESVGSGSVSGNVCSGDACNNNNLCGGKQCLTNEVCRNDQCKPNGDPCGSDWCYQTQFCRDNTCIDKGDSCGNTFCAPDEKCNINKCVPGGEQCGSKWCKVDEKCVGDSCVPGGPQCGDTYCYANEVCRNNACSPNGDPCGDTWCYQDEICRDDVCGKPGATCGDTQCFVTEICDNNTCVQPAALCGGIACAVGQVCHNEICHDEGTCGGLTCSPDETCENNVCRLPGSCGGLMCTGEEKCVDNICRMPGNCGSIACFDTEYCLLGSLCVEREICGDTRCEGNDVCENGTCVPNKLCANGTNRCGEVCCDNTQFCGDRSSCCDLNQACGHDCCTSGEVCVNEICHLDCGSNNRCADKDGNEFCCGPDQICTANQCFRPSVSCVDNYMCEDGQFCDSLTHQCMPNPSGEVCKLEQVGGEVQPTLVWYWGYGDLAPKANEFPEHLNVMSSPMVADVDGDGTPEVIFNSWRINSTAYQGGGILRIVDGKSGVMKAFSNGNPYTDGGSQTAIGKLYPIDKYPDQTVNGVDVSGLQIVTCVVRDGHYRIAAFNHRAQLIWEHPSTVNHCGQSGPGIADFNADGLPEVYSRYNVYNGQTGELINRVSCGDDAAAHVMCDYSVAADINNDGYQELVGGNVAYKVDVANKKLIEVYHRTDHPDGYPSIADLDGDTLPEIVSVRSEKSYSGELNKYAHTIMAFKSDGKDFWTRAVDTNPKDYIPESEGRSGGPATIAYVDGSGKPSITFAGGYGYIVLDNMGNVKWARRTQDRSSRKTGSSVFDFDGDGKAEIVYGDELWLRVYDGATGETRFCQCNLSATHWEYPVIADVNDDGHAEIIISSNRYNESTNCPSTLDDAHGGDDACVKKLMKDPNALVGTRGVRVFAAPDNDWINTRKIYNQHAYSITNVSDDGTIPKVPRQNWKTQGLNNFRLNVQPGATYLPNLIIQDISSPYKCQSVLPVYFNVTNDGWAVAKSGVDVNVYYSDKPDEGFTLYTTVKTTKQLGAGEKEGLHFDFTLPDNSKPPYYFKLSFTESAPTMCRTNDKDQSYTLVCADDVN